jgi:transcriptional regulator with XRE-family HTH domain
VNSQIPHHTWAASKEGAEAWMVFRDLGGSPAAITLTAEHPSFRRRVTETDLQNSGRFASIAWGIAEKIRIHRQKASLTTRELAKEVDADPSYLSRLEAGEANPSLEMLLRISRILFIDVEGLVRSSAWCWAAAQMPLMASKNGFRKLPVLADQDTSKHCLHTSHLLLPESVHTSVYTSDASTRNSLATWIILRGRVLLDLPEALGGNSEILEEGSLIHFREYGSVRVQALNQSSVVRIVCSENCVCR